MRFRVVRKRRRKTRVGFAKASEFVERAENREARERVARAMAPAVEQVLEDLRTDVGQFLGDSPAVSQRLGAIPNSIPWRELENDLVDAIHPHLERAVEEGAELGQRFATGGIELDAAFVLERSRGFIGDTAFTAAANVTANTRRAVVTVLDDLLTEQVTFSQASKTIGNIVGLDTRRARALATFERNLRAQLAPDVPVGPLSPQVQGTIDRRVESMRARMLRQRGVTIADTEVQRAVRHGEDQYWLEVQEQGLTPFPILKVWKTVRDVDVCKICEPLHNNVVELKEPFETSVGLRIGPPAHPRCRCYPVYDVQTAEEVA